MMKKEGLTAEAMDTIMNKKSGVLGFLGKVVIIEILKMVILQAMKEILQ